MAEQRGANEAKLRDYLKRATADLDKAHHRLGEMEASRREPIAIVGMACRYPGGVDSPAALWQLLTSGTDAISPFPADRGWDLERLYDPDPDAPGTSYAREGGFLADATEFDAEFFGISPREALAMDPQQRVLLETAWEALEAAGIDPESLGGEPAGVFAGISSQDYVASIGNSKIEGYRAAGVATSVASGRISYALGLQGPAITVDTACSSSLVTLHLAAQALRGGECSLALAGGVTVMATPGLFTEFARQRGLAPDGRSKSFADAADGAGFSDGVGMLVLERLSDAHRNGHQVLATIKGSAVNQDGASNGLTAPNGPSQERVIRQALANARLTPQDIDAVEAHGTGTTLGDPIEAGALLATYGQDREQPLHLGSIKSNIGHTQAAAGVAGVIKMTMALREGTLPRTLHVDAPSSRVDWEAGQVELLREAREWKADGRPRRAGISSFGISGTNAHLILEEAPQPEPGQGEQAQEGGEDPEVALPGPIPLVLSAKSEPALQEQAARLASHLRENPGLDPTDVAYSLATTRSSFEHRAVALGEGREQLLDSLAVLAEGTDALNTAHAQANPQRPVFLFPGQGSQWEGMALELLEASPVFASHMAECEQALSPHVEWSLTGVLAEEGGAWMDRLDIVQPALFAVMVSLARLWQELGVQPSAVVGHSQGEIAAAHVAGALSLRDATLIVAERGKAMARIAGRGAMLSVSLSPSELEPLLEPYGDRVSIAAINGPASLALSGEPGALTQLMAECKAEGVRTQPIAVDYAAHSAQIDDLQEELLEAFAPISPRSGQIPLHSTVTGEPIDTARLGAEYWFSNLRQTVLLEPVLASLFEAGRRTFIEIGPHPVLAFALQESAEAHLPHTEQATVLGTLRRAEGGPQRFALSLAQAHAAGVPVEWEAFFKGTKAKRVPLPTYPFQRRRYWMDSALGGSGDLTAAGQVSADHPLLGAAVQIAGGEGEGLLLTGRISLATHPWLGDHAVAGAILLPGAAFLELALKAAEEVGAAAVAELTLQAPLVLSEQGAVQIQVSVSSPGGEGEREISIHSRPEEEGGEEEEWTCHGTGLLTAETPEPSGLLGAWPPEGAEPVDFDDPYGRLADAGLEYGPAFQGLAAVWREGDDVYAEAALSEELAREGQGFAIHPALLDAALHAAALVSLDSQRGPMLPFAWGGVSLQGAGADSLRVKISPEGEKEISLTLTGPDGTPIARVDSLAVRPVDTSQLQAAGRGPDGLLEIGWQQVSLASDEQDSPEVALWRSGVGEGSGADAALAAAQAVLAAVQAHLSDADPEQRLAILTEGALAAIEGESPDPAQAAIWGLVRSAQSEHPGRFALIDSDGSEASEAALGAALAAGAQEPQLALRGGEALAGRALSARERSGSLIPPPGSWRLDPGKGGSLEGLSLLPSPEPERPLGPTEVRVQMHAAGLNFRDVVVTLGFEVPGGRSLGGEGAGVVAEVGSEVGDLTPGDRVMGVIPDAFGPLAITDRSLLVPLPEDWSYKQGAAVPSVFCTSYYGLADLAGLEPGERVLIHAAAGGVGMAAVQIARHLGAEVFGTASPSKWEALEGMGISADHIASSRDLDFKDRFLAVTGGEGMDVILNSLAGEFVDASLELLPRGGRFLEMGKTDIRDAERVAAGHPGVSYRAFDLLEAGSERLGEMLAEIAELFAGGTLGHSPIASWDMRRAPEAFRHLREGKNIGKVVLEVTRSFDPGKTILITGATGGLGAIHARHLVAEHGARHLLLVSRSGESAEGAKELKAELEDLGAEVAVAACDVSDRAQIEELLDSIPTEHPLGAVLHAAGALDDGLIEAMDPERLEAVFAPKANAAQYLHELTIEADLSAFVLFSSAAGVFGGPAQANYAAANAYLDALAQSRTAQGLAATSIAWGLWRKGSGLTSHLEEADLARLSRSGIAALSEQQGVQLFDAALAADRPNALALALDRAGLRSAAQTGSLPPLLSGLVRVPKRRQGAAGSLAAKLAALPEAEREGCVLDLVRAEVAAVLGHDSAAEVDPERAFKELGFDSLAAVELRNRLNAATGLRLGTTVVFDHPTSALLAEHLLTQAGTTVSARQTAVKAQATDEPIAIVGMACRYPGGVDSPAALWQLLTSGTDAISPFPADRGWDLERLYDPDPDAPGTSYAREGGFLADATEFDAEFFGISPREALAMDPQQRVLLETAWEALEAAGIDPESLRGEPAGVFAGISSQDYAVAMSAAGDEYEGHASTGNLTSVASGRISYALGLQGPAMTVDTACSSSLTAMHLAGQALRGGECSLALAGGATVMATPLAFTQFSRQRGLAPDGRSKSFAEAADGAGWSDGVGMLVLERLSDAHRNGHQVLATIKGSAVNQDGASNGLTAPNGPSQERVIRQALANARLTPQDIDAVEAHGTGTTLGDPIEAGALLATYGQDREQPLHLGSIKSNIGHTQAAAGVAGVIKMTMALREGTLPRTLHVDAPSSRVDWEAGQVELLREAREWKADGRPRRAGISSFGISGTNAHLILEEAPQPEPGQGEQAQEGGEDPEVALPGPIPLVLSAKSEPALQEQAARLASHLRENPGLDPTDVAYSLATTRSSFEHRAVALGEGREQLLDSLAVLAEGTDALNTAHAQANPQRPVFLFPGQGSQWEGMALELLEASPVFASHMAECEQALSPHVEWSLTGVLAEEGGAWMDRLDIVQPALFAVMVSLARLWQELGVQPSAVVGHSQGEIAAAHVAGALSLRDATLIVAERGKAMARIAGRGAMLSVSLSPSELEPLLEPYGDRVSIAAINGPASLALSGEPGALTQLMAECKAEGVRTQPIAVDYAAHSAQIDDLQEELLEAFAPISPRSGQIPLHSTVTGEPIDTARLGAEYWFSNLRQTVLLEPVLASLFEAGRRTFIEIGPHPVLAFALQESAEAHLPHTEQATVLGTLRRAEGGPQRFALSLAQAHAAGVPVEWEAFFKGTKAKRVPLPTYPFQRRRYWIEASQGSGDLSSTGLASAEHPLLSAVVEDPRSEALTLTGRISLATHPWLTDHALAGNVILPGTAFLELALKAAEQAGAETLAELTLQAPLVLSEQGAVQIQVTVSAPEEGGEREIQIHSRPDEEGAEWTHNAQGLLSEEASAAPEPIGTWPPEGAEPIETEDVYERFADIGVEYGPAFQGLTAAWRKGEEVFAEVSLPEELAEQARGFAVHPALLDAALHGIGLLEAEDLGAGGGPLMPFAWGGVTLQTGGAGELRVRLGSQGGSVSLSAFGPDGTPIARVDSLAVRPVDTSQLQAAGRGPDGLLEIGWQQVSLASDEQDSPEVALWRSGVGEGSGADAALAAAQAVLAAVQAHLSDADPEQRLAILTEGALAAIEGESPDPAQAAIWGLVRSAQSEHPGRFALIDSDGSEASEAALGAALAAGAQEPQLALRGGEALAGRAGRLGVSPGDEGDEARSFDPDRTVLITGATGVLGALHARHLVAEHGVRHLLLVSRSGEDAEGAKELREELRELGAEATIAACDVSEREQLEELLDSIPEEHSLGAVIHAAGVLADGLIEAMEPERLEVVFAPKANAAQHLHELTAGKDLSAFVLFSSASGALGGPGQANYAAANAYLDALATRRRAEGLPATSIAWGLWRKESGLTSQLEGADLARLSRSGIAPLSEELGLALFDEAIHSDHPMPLALALDRAGLRSAAQTGSLPPLLSGLVRVPRRRQGAAGSLAAKLVELSEAEREGYVLGLVRAEVAAVLGHDSAAQIDPERAFKDLGFDSLAAVELRNRLGLQTGLRLPATLVFDYPNALDIAGYLLEEVGGSEGSDLQTKLGQLEEALGTVPSEDPARQKLALHLRALAADLEGSDGADGIAESVDAQLESASDEELLSFIDEQVGGGDG